MTTASVGLLVTLPAEWAAMLRLRVECPECRWAYESRGAQAFNELAVFINQHVATECPKRRHGP